MKLAIPVLQNNDRLSQISEHFGHAPFFAFITVEEDGKWDVQIDLNPGAADHMLGQIPSYLISQNVDVLAVLGIGNRTIQLFEQGGIKVFRGAGGLLEEVVNEYLEDKLEDQNYQVKDKHPGNHQHHV